MYLPVLATLIAAAVASPLAHNLNRRASSCGSMSTKTTTVAGAVYTLTGPFQMTAQGDFDKSGYYAHFGTGDGEIPQIIFDVSPPRRDADASSFYLNKAGHMVTVQDDALYRGYVTSPVDDGNLDDENVIMSVDTGLGNKLMCEMSDSCELTCNVDNYDFHCLASPGFQPDWRISSEAKGAGVGCVQFTPMAVPM